MKIASNAYNALAEQIISVVRQSSSPLGIAQTLERVNHEAGHASRDVTLALVWHLLANHRLEFDETRKLTIPAEDHELQPL